MDIIGLDGFRYRLNFIKSSGERGIVSRYHQLARELLHELYPMDIMYEEVSLPGTEGLRLDFFIPARYLGVEVQGEQHYKFNNFFYSSKIDFYKAQARDRNKEEWCQLNKIRLVQLPYSEKYDEWRERIISIKSK